MKLWSEQERRAFESLQNISVNVFKVGEGISTAIAQEKKEREEKYKWSKAEDRRIAAEEEDWSFSGKILGIFSLKGSPAITEYSPLYKIVDINIKKNKAVEDYARVTGFLAKRHFKNPPHEKPIIILLKESREVPPGKDPVNYYSGILKKYLTQVYKHLPTYSELKKKGINEMLAMAYYGIRGPPDEEQSLVTALEMYVEELRANHTTTILLISDKRWINYEKKKLKDAKIDNVLRNAFEMCFYDESGLYGYSKIADNMANLVETIRDFYKWYREDSFKYLRYPADKRISNAISNFFAIRDVIDKNNRRPLRYEPDVQLSLKSLVSKLIMLNIQLKVYFRDIAYNSTTVLPTDTHLDILIDKLKMTNVYNEDERNLWIEIFGIFDKDIRNRLVAINEIIMRRQNVSWLQAQACEEFDSILLKTTPEIINDLESINYRIKRVYQIWKDEDELLLKEASDKTNYYSIDSRSGDWWHHRSEFISKFSAMMHGQLDKTPPNWGEDQLLWLFAKQGDEVIRGLKYNPNFRRVLAYLFSLK